MLDALKCDQIQNFYKMLRTGAKSAAYIWLEFINKKVKKYILLHFLQFPHSLTNFLRLL